MSATMCATLPFIDERQLLTMIQPVLPLHECADPTPAESAAPAESTTEPLHSAAGAALTETS
jgi:hypothetical protein